MRGFPLVRCAATTKVVGSFHVHGGAGGNENSNEIGASNVGGHWLVSHTSLTPRANSAKSLMRDANAASLEPSAARSTFYTALMFTKLRLEFFPLFVPRFDRPFPLDFHP